MTADPNADNANWKFTTLQDVFDYIAASGEKGLIWFVLDSDYYLNWNNATTVNRGEYVLADTLIGMNGNIFTYDAAGNISDFSLTEITLTSGTKLTIENSSGNSIIDFKNISITVDEGASFTVTGNSAIRFSGNGIGYDYVDWSDTDQKGNPYVHWQTYAESYTSPGMINYGTLELLSTIGNGVSVKHDTSAGKIGNLVKTIQNYGTITVKGAELCSYDSTANHQVYQIHNVNGSVVISDTGPYASTLTVQGTGAESAVIRNEVAGTVHMSNANVNNRSEIRLSGGTSNGYAVYNDGTANFENIFISATGGSRSVGLFIGTEGVAEFKVTATPDKYLDVTSFAELGADEVANVLLYCSQIYNITGDGYSVYNLHQLTATTTYSSATLTLNDTRNGIEYSNAPVYALNGTVYTQAKVDALDVGTTLDRVTINGDIQNSGTGNVNLTDVYLNGDIENGLRYDGVTTAGTNMYIIGSFRGSRFDITMGKTVKVADWTSNSITITNYQYLANAGNIYFGRDRFFELTPVQFNERQLYSFINYGGTMEVTMFVYQKDGEWVSSLSSDDHPVTIWNEGIFIMDPVNEKIAEQEPDSPYTALTEKSFSIYVKAGQVASGTGYIANDVMDSGIVNNNPNQFNPTYYINNEMVLSDLDIRNTEASFDSSNVFTAGSVAITNLGGNLTVNRGSVQGTFSGIDSLVKGYIAIGNTPQFTYYITRPTLSLNDVVKVAGQGFSLRNTGDMTVIGKADGIGTLFTDKTDFQIAYSGDYTAIANYSATIYFMEHYQSTTNTPNWMRLQISTGLQAFYSGQLDFNKQSATSLSSSEVVLSYYTASDVYRKTDIDLGDPCMTATVIANSVTHIEWFYGNYAVYSNAALNNIAFQTTALIGDTTAIMNDGNIVVTGINSKDNEFDGFTYSFNNSYNLEVDLYDNAYTAGSSVWASSWKNNIDIGIGCDISKRAYTVTGATSHAALIPNGDYTYDSRIRSSTIRTSSVYQGEITLRGVESNVYEGVYSGYLDVEGPYYQIYTTQTLTLVNFSVKAVSAINQDGIHNYGRLYVFNGKQNDKGAWIGPSNALITAYNGTAIENNGLMIMFNGAVINSKVGLNQLYHGVSAIINSTFYNNSEYAIISDNDTPESTTMYLLVADTTITGKGNGIWLKHGQLDMINSIVLTSGTSLKLDNGAALSTKWLDSNGNGIDFTSSNIIGGDATDTLNKLEKTYGTRDFDLLLFCNDLNVVLLVDNSLALSNGFGLYYEVNDGKYTFSAYALSSSKAIPDGAIDITWDKAGNERKTGVGSYTITGLPGNIVVNIIGDSANFNTSHFAEKHGAYSLREVIYAIQKGFLTSNEVQFDWDALVAQMGASWDVTIMVDLGSIEIKEADNIIISGVNNDGIALTIDASGNGESAFAVTGSNLSLKDLALVGSVTSGHGGAISIESGTVNLANVAISGGEAALGSAIYLASSNAYLTASETTFSSNKASAGGAIYNRGGQVKLSGEKNSFSKNWAVNGGAIFNDGGNLSVNKTFFTENTAAENGGTIYNTGSALTVADSIFLNNSANNGGAICNESGTLKVTDTHFEKNESVGAVILSSNGLSLNGGSFVNNTGNESVINATSGYVDIDGVIFSGNESRNSVVAAVENVTVTGGSFINNRGTGSLVKSDETVTINSTTFTGNTNMGDLITGQAVTVNGGSFINNTGNESVINATLRDIEIDGNAIFSKNESKNSVVAANGNVTVHGGQFMGNTGNQSVISAGRNVTLEEGATFSRNSSSESVVSANGDVYVIAAGFENNTGAGALLNSADGNVIIDAAIFSGNTNTGNLVTGQSVTVNSGSFVGNIGNRSVINAADTVNVQESVFRGNGTQTLISGRDVILNESSIYGNTATEAIVHGSNRLFVVSTTIAENSAALDLQGGDVTVVNSTIAEDSGILIEGNKIQIVNSIVVTKDNSDAVAGTEIAVAYSTISGKVSATFTDGMKSGLSYADVFGNNTLANGFISLPADSPAMQGVWTAIDYNTNKVYYSTVPEGIWGKVYNKDTVYYNLLGYGSIGGVANVPASAVFANGYGGSTPNMGAVWNITWRPDSGPGVNDTFIDPSFNGIGWNNNDIYNIVADNLVMNSGFLLNFRNEMPVGGHWYYDFTHAFDDRYSTMDRFAVTQGRFDLGIIPSGETYITINVNGNISDDFTRYTTTPYLSDGTPLIPEELESMNPEITAPAEAVFTFPAELEEKVMSYLRRVEIFKDDYDKALDSFLKV